MYTRTIFFIMIGMLAQPANVASAASFDCNKAVQKVETAICTDPALSALDDQLSVAYKELQTQLGDPDALLRMQREWLTDSRGSCNAQAGQMNDCLLQVYQSRINLLRSLKTVLTQSGQEETVGSRHELKDASKKYDFRLYLTEKCEAKPDQDYSSCESPGIVSVSKKGEAAVLQYIPMENIFLSFSESKKPLANSARLYDYQGVINVGDFNFDGEEDFAIQNGNAGSYNGPSYDVFVKSRTAPGFRYSVEMSGLIAQTLGFFQVQPGRKRLIARAKSGCCYHELTVYEVINDKPVPSSRSIDEILQNGRHYFYEEEWVNDKWKRLKTKRLKNIVQ